MIEQQRQRSASPRHVGPLVRPSVGDEVVCLAGEAVGRVIAVFDATFKVQTPSEVLVLPMEAVYLRSMKRTTLLCNHSGLERYRVGGSPL